MYVRGSGLFKSSFLSYGHGDWRCLVGSKKSANHFTALNRCAPLQATAVQTVLATGTLQGKLAQLLPVHMRSREHHLSRTESTLGCTVAVHDAQSLRTTSETRVKLECSAHQLAAVE
jgi:hypothetical protein